MRADQILELMRPAVLVCDRGGMVVQAAGGFGSYAGWPVEYFVGKHALELVIEEDREPLASVFIQAQERDDFTVAQPIPFRIRTASPDGAIFSADAIATGQPAGDDAGWVVVLHPHDQQTTPVAALTSLLEAQPLERTLELAADHIAGSGSDGRQISAVLLTAGLLCEGLRTFGTTMPHELADEIGRHGATLLCEHSLSAPTPLHRPALPTALADAVVDADYEELILAHVPVGDTGAATLVVANGTARDPLVDNVRQLIDRAAQVAELALRSDREHRILLHASRHDPLTGLGNRRRLDEFVADRSGRRLTMIFVDLDRFKEVNDRHGHAIGDEVLRTVADRIAASCRPDDLACRVGGDEFVVVVDDVDHDEAERIAERIGLDIATPLPRHVGIESVTASIGLADSGRHGTMPSVFVIAAADDAMRRAKSVHRRP